MEVLTLFYWLYSQRGKQHWLFFSLLRYLIYCSRRACQSRSIFRKYDTGDSRSIFGYLPILGFILILDLNSKDLPSINNK